jgi:hypothetical protein
MIRKFCGVSYVEKQNATHIFGIVFCSKKNFYKEEKIKKMFSFSRDFK